MNNFWRFNKRFNLKTFRSLTFFSLSENLSNSDIYTKFTINFFIKLYKRNKFN